MIHIAAAELHDAVGAVSQESASASLVDRARVKAEDAPANRFDRSVVLIGDGFARRSVAPEIELHAASRVVARDGAVIDQMLRAVAQDGAFPVQSLSGTYRYFIGGEIEIGAVIADAVEQNAAGAEDLRSGVEAEIAYAVYRVGGIYSNQSVVG